MQRPEGRKETGRRVRRKQNVRAQASRSRVAERLCKRHHAARSPEVEPDSKARGQAVTQEREIERAVDTMKYPLLKIRPPTSINTPFPNSQSPVPICPNLEHPSPKAASQTPTSPKRGRRTRSAAIPVSALPTGHAQDRLSACGIASSCPHALLGGVGEGWG